MPRPTSSPEQDPLARFHAPVRDWFGAVFEAPTKAQRLGWGAIDSGRSTLLLAPTGSGKTLAAFLSALDRLMFEPLPAKERRLRILYVSPLKALGVDIERNLRAPIAGITTTAERLGVPCLAPDVAVRSGDTPSKERQRFARHPSDILITTPESLYLLLTSKAREALRAVDTVIVDEIHSLVASKRGAHLFLSLERLEALRGPDARPLQRIGLSATQRPLDEVARLLAGNHVPSSEAPVQPRPVDIVDASDKKRLELRVEVPVEDMTDLDGAPAGPGPEGALRKSIWPAMHPRLVELIRSHRSTMLFVNSRRLSERLATAINDLAEEELARAHHGSLSKEQRSDVEERLKAGQLPAIVATSSLELGIDMGAVDLVIQVEAPPSVASGLQRVGRAGHQVGAASQGVLFPKYRGDLLATAAAVERMHAGLVEETRYPRNPLDVLAQQIVAIVAMDALPVDDLLCLVRQAAPFSELARETFENVLDMLSGRFPSDDFADLKARVTWDRVSGILRPRQGAARVAVINGGTIPDRGLYGVFLAGTEEAKPVRVGELDEEMVFESRPGEVFLLGASSWRIEDITHDRVLVSPAPGQPGKMPFWHGDRPGRPAELGRAIGALTRKLSRKSDDAALAQLQADHDFDERAADNLVRYLGDQKEHTRSLPTDRAIVLERFQDELGDHRVCLLSPFGARVHAPWALAVTGRLQEEYAGDVETLWTDDGIVFRVPETEAVPDTELFVPRADEVEALITAQLAGTSLFAARFRENAARALLLPRKSPKGRRPLWMQRKKAQDLLAVASRFGNFPIVLETYRECLRDVFDLPALRELLTLIERRQLALVTVDSRAPSPFAASLLFSYVANFLYEGDAPPAERRALSLTIDHAQLAELLGDAQLRELLDPEAIEAVERGLQRLDEGKARHADGLHDLLRSIGDLTEAEVAARIVEPEHAAAWVEGLVSERRVVRVPVAGEARVVAVEDVGRYRDALGVVPPPGVPVAFLESVPDPVGDLVARFARTHGPFVPEHVAHRLGLGIAPVRQALARLEANGRLLQGEFTPGGLGRELCDAGVLRAIKRRSLARLRKEVEPVEEDAYARFLIEWQGLDDRARGPDALLEVVDQLQGLPLPVSVLLADILPARVEGFRPSELDLLCAEGEILWRGFEPIGSSDARIALYLADQYPLLAPDREASQGELEARIRDTLEARGASFFSEILTAAGGFSGDALAALWALVWAGEVTNDTLAPLRAQLASAGGQGSKGVRGRGRRRAVVSRQRRAGPPGSEGRWALLPGRDRSFAQGGAWPSETERRTTMTRALVERYGVLTREAVQQEGTPGGFSTVYPVLKAMEDAGRLRRGYFIAGMGATQFARPGCEERLRAFRHASDDEPSIRAMAATDPANPYGAVVRWPKAEPRPQRAAGAHIVLLDGALVAYLGRGGKSLQTFLPEAEPRRGRAIRAVAEGVLQLGRRLGGLLLTRIDGGGAAASPVAAALVEVGFADSSQGMLLRLRKPSGPRGRPGDMRSAPDGSDRPPVLTRRSMLDR